MLSVKGFTLVELIVATAVIAILAALAIPTYNGYITTTRENTAITNALSIKPYLEEFYLETGSYIKDSDTIYNRAELSSYFGWSSDLDEHWKYEVTASADNWSIKTTYKGTTVSTKSRDELKL